MILMNYLILIFNKKELYSVISNFFYLTNIKAKKLFKLKF